jgi:hypothetical protein
VRGNPHKTPKNNEREKLKKATWSKLPRSKNKFDNSGCKRKRNEGKTKEEK